MKAMILAAGQGTRMRPLTYLMPKPMIPLVRTPVLETLITHLADAGVRDIIINTSYMSDSLQTYFGDGQQWGVNIAYSFEGRIEDGELVGHALGSAGGIKRVQEFSGFFDERFLVMCGDAYVDFNVQAFETFHTQQGAIASLLTQTVPMDSVSEYGVVATDNSGQVLEFQEKPLPEEAVSNMVNTGIYLFEPEVIDHIPINQIYDIGGELFPYLAANNKPLFAMNQEFNWLDIGRLADFFTCHDRVLSGAVKTFPIPGREVRPGVWLGNNVRVNLDKVQLNGPVVIGPSCHIEDGAHITGPTVLGNNCHVRAGAQLENVFTADFLRFGSTAQIEGSIVRPPYMINRDQQVTRIDQVTHDISDARADNQAAPLLIPRLANVPSEQQRSGMQA